MIRAMLYDSDMAHRVVDSDLWSYDVIALRAQPGC